jgi:flagellar protein FlaF
MLRKGRHVNVIEQARLAYAPTQPATRTDRSVEAQLFSQVTARLRQTSATPKAAYPELIDAIHQNRRLWTTMAAGVADVDALVDVNTAVLKGLNGQRAA